jgi:FkbM family methyltransferase
MPFARELLAKILRVPVSLISPDTEVRILSGPIRGKKWIKGAGPNAYWMGTYETERFRDLAEAVRPGAVVYDIGANVGIYSLLASSLAGAAGAVYAFEPLERNLRYLRRHVVLNDLQNCAVMEMAVSNQEGTLSFSTVGFDASMARLSPDGEISVQSTTVDNCVYGERRLRPPNVIKIDVEGAELEVLEGGSRAIGEFRPAIFCEIHGDRQHAECRAFLLAKGYQVVEGYGQLTAKQRDR